MNLITNAAEKVKDIAVQVKTATEEQSLQSKQIRKSTDVVSEKSQQIANAINEQYIRPSGEKQEPLIQGQQFPQVPR